MVMSFILTVLAVFVVLCVSEIGWRKHWLRGEFGRKFVHMTVGSFIALWPYFLSWNEIRLLSLAFLVGVGISSRLKLFHAIGSVQRPTFGEICFAAVVGLLTFITHSKGIYAAAILQMSLADGMAAIIGTKFGRDNKYHVLGHNKSIVGTAAFLIISIALLVGYAIFGSADISIATILVGSFGAAALENLAPLGLDNIAVPLYIGTLLTTVR